MANYKLWTSKEEQILKDYVEKCSTITEACEKVAKKTGRSAKAVVQHYYKSKQVLTLCDNSSMFDKFVLLLKEVFTK